MKSFIKRFWLVFLIALVINLPLVLLGTIRTDKSITLKGDTTIVSDFVEIEKAYKAEGTFSTIYVISMDHSTLFQNLILKNNVTAEVEDLPTSYLHFSDAEIAQMGRIQHQASIDYALILAYRLASKIDNGIHLDYKFKHLEVYYYSPNSDFRIGDQIVGVNGTYGTDDFEAFRVKFNEAMSKCDGDIVHVKRGSKELLIPLNEKNKVLGAYSMYDIKSDTAAPKYKIKASNVGGPSGGLLQTLALYNSLIETDITKGRKIAGTGTININGIVGEIGGIKQKILTAYDDKMEVFLCPEANYEDALIAYNTLKHKERMKLYKISTFEQALEVLKNV